jgi:hypothetical protein
VHARTGRGNCRPHPSPRSTNSQPSYFFTLPSASQRRVCSSKRVEQLLAGGGAGEGGAVVQGPAEAAEIQVQALGGAAESHAHAVEHVDDARRGLAHGLHRGLVGQEVAAVNGVVEVLGRGCRLRPSGFWRR